MIIITVILTTIALAAMCMGFFAMLPLLPLHVLCTLWQRQIPRFTVDVEQAIATKLSRYGWAKEGVTTYVSGDAGNSYLARVHTVYIGMVETQGYATKHGMSLHETLTMVYAHECGHTHQDEDALNTIYRTWSLVLAMEEDAWMQAATYTTLNPALVGSLLGSYHTMASLSSATN